MIVKLKNSVGLKLRSREGMLPVLKSTRNHISNWDELDATITPIGTEFKSEKMNF